MTVATTLDDEDEVMEEGFKRFKAALNGHGLSRLVADLRERVAVDRYRLFRLTTHG